MTDTRSLARKIAGATTEAIGVMLATSTPPAIGYLEDKIIQDSRPIGGSEENAAAKSKVKDDSSNASSIASYLVFAYQIWRLINMEVNDGVWAQLSMRERLGFSLLVGLSILSMVYPINRFNYEKNTVAAGDFSGLGVFFASTAAGLYSKWARRSTIERSFQVVDDDPLDNEIGHLLRTPSIQGIVPK